MSPMNGNQLPDVGHDVPSKIQAPIDWVGMSGMEFAVRVRRGQDSYLIPAKVDAQVNLVDPAAKGIHMSRLYLLVKSALTEEGLCAEGIRKLLESSLQSHVRLSTKAKVELRFELPRLRRALQSGVEGWRNYPVTVRGELQGDEFSLVLGAQVLYSSTCPCSAALSGQLIEERFRQAFDGGDQVSREDVGRWLRENGSTIATPHAQRSLASIFVRSKEQDLVSFLDNLVDLIEGSLMTAVQAAVKREDEQHFARLNAENLMFCEDSARRIRQALHSAPSVLDYQIEVEHIESLHPHSAVSKLVKGIPNGFRF